MRWVFNIFGRTVGCNIIWHSRNRFPEEGTEEEKKVWRKKHKENCSCLMGNKKLVNDVDYLTVESTYGDRVHGELSASEERLAQVVEETIARRSKVVIPPSPSGGLSN